MCEYCGNPEHTVDNCGMAVPTHRITCGEHESPIQLAYDCGDCIACGCSCEDGAEWDRKTAARKRVPA